MWLSSGLYGRKTSVGLASDFPEEFRKIKKSSDETEKIILLFWEINFIYRFKIEISVPMQIELLLLFKNLFYAPGQKLVSNSQTYAQIYDCKLHTQTTM